MGVGKSRGEDPQPSVLGGEMDRNRLYSWTCLEERAGTPGQLREGKACAWSLLRLGKGSQRLFIPTVSSEIIHKQKLRNKYEKGKSQADPHIPSSTVPPAGNIQPDTEITASKGSWGCKGGQRPCLC